MSKALHIENKIFAFFWSFLCQRFLFGLVRARTLVLDFSSGGPHAARSALYVLTQPGSRYRSPYSPVRTSLPGPAMQCSLGITDFPRDHSIQIEPGINEYLNQVMALFHAWTFV